MVPMSFSSAEEKKQGLIYGGTVRCGAVALILEMAVLDVTMAVSCTAYVVNLVNCCASDVFLKLKMTNTCFWPRL